MKVSGLRGKTHDHGQDTVLRVEAGGTHAYQCKWPSDSPGDPDSPFPPLSLVLLEAKALDRDLFAVARAPDAFPPDRRNVDPLALHDPRRRLGEEHIERPAFLRRDLESGLDSGDPALERRFVDWSASLRSALCTWDDRVTEPTQQREEA